jgi:hypothetical protein
MMKPKIPGIEDRVFDQAGARSYLALALLHDVGLDQVSADNSALIRQLNEAIGFLDRERQAEFIPYWETAGLAGFVEWQADRAGRLSWREGQPDDVYVSIYRAQAEPKRALLWIVNAGTTPRLTGLRLDAQALTGRPRRDVIVRDIETGIQLRKHLPDSVKAANDKETLWRSFLLKPRDYVGLMVEQGDYVNPPHPVAWP